MFIYYDESILAYVSSIRKYFGLSSSYDPNTKFLDYLNKKSPNKIFLVLIDGMGANLLERKLDKESFLRRNQLYKVTTVFPTTTTAAVTSISNGKGPNENAWISWQEYFEDIDDVIIPFLGKGYYNDNNYGINFAYDRIPFIKTDDELNQIGIKAKEIYPEFRKDGCRDFDEFASRLIDESYSDTRYVYAYWDKYDQIMHFDGPDSKEADSYLKYINDKLEEVSKKISDDTMLVIVADHGQVAIEEPIYIEGSKYEKYMYRKSSIESRATGFYVKDEYKEEFEKGFKNDFENDFILLTKDNILETKLFGANDNHPYFEKLLPDYLAIAKTNKAFAYQKGGTILKGQHAGICDDEVYIPVITYKK